jgi:DNA-directed RNA polymerase specialized sigma24 family protein
MRKARNYINNRALFQIMQKYRLLALEAKEAGDVPPPADKYVGEAILKICYNLAKKGCFSGYSWKEDMISDGLIDCVSAIKNFNPEKSNNPFAYFTQIAHNAFLRRIAKEKKQNYIKHKNYEVSFMMETLHVNGMGSAQLSQTEASSAVIGNFETSLETASLKNAKPVEPKGVELYYSE